MLIEYGKKTHKGKQLIGKKAIINPDNHMGC